MKRFGKSVPFILLLGPAALLLALVVGCALEAPVGKFAEGGSTLTYLPPDVVNDEVRSLEGEFQFKTLLPVTFRLKVDAYNLIGVTAGTARSLTPVAKDLKGEVIHIVVVLTTTDKKTIYMGHITSEDTLEFDAILPSAPQDLLLTLIADGFSPRIIVLKNPVEYKVIDRELAIGMTEKTKKEKYIDSDKDYIPDKYDAFPKDAGLAFVVQVPPDEPMTVAFEDLYPVPGDADYNDFNAAYWITEYYSSFGERKKIEGAVTARARGAAYNHLFGIRIFLGPDVEGTLTVDYLDQDRNPIDATTDPVKGTANIVIFEETKKAFQRPTDWVTFDNAYPDRLDSEGFTTKFTIDLLDHVVPDPENKQWLPYSLPPYDPYIYVYSTNPHRDIHLIDMPKLEDSKNLDSDPPDFRYDKGEYVGFPWGMILPVDWPYPVERVDIHDSYPDFQEWYQNNGTKAPDWYENPNPDLVIQPEVPEPPEPPPPQIYDVIYIETFHPEGPGEAATDTRLELYLDGDPTPMAVSALVEGKFEDLEIWDVERELYYIRVTGAGSGKAGGPYALWVLQSTRADAPTPPIFTPGFEGPDSDDATLPWEGGGSVPIGPGESAYVDRYLYPDGADVDWFMLDLR